MEGSRRSHNDVLLVSIGDHLHGPFLEGMGRVRTAPGEEEEVGGEVLTASTVRWRLDTRYYTADLRLAQVRHSDAAVLPDTSVRAAVQSQLAHGTCDALLLLCDSAEEGTSTKLRVWQSVMEELAPAVQLCIVANASEESDGSLQAIEEWCVDNAVELIVWNPSDARCVGEAVSRGLLEETKGLDRVLEALEANMWPVMTMKPRPANSIRPLTSPQNEEPNGPAHAPTGPMARDAPPNDQPKREVPPIAKEASHDKSTEDEDDQKWTDDIDKHFEKAFQQLAGLREVRQNSEKMSDKDRRELAAETALALARTLGLNLDDSDSD